MSSGGSTLNSPKESFRPDLYVVSRIIKTLVDEGPQRKTILSTKAGLSYDNLARYTDWMIFKELLEENGGLLHATDKGISTYNGLVDWIITYVGKLKFGKGPEK